MTELTRAQKRARHALATWRKTELDDALRADYRTLAHGFGAQVLRSGLLAAVAFARRYRNPKAADLMLDALFDDEVMSVARLRGTRADALVDAVAALDATAYMLATREVLAALVWFRRAAQGVGDVRGDDIRPVEGHP